jgi:hypothetical protein
MAGKPRFNTPGIPQHVIRHANNRDPDFFSSHDWRCYLDVNRDQIPGSSLIFRLRPHFNNSHYMACGIRHP